MVCIDCNEETSKPYWDESGLGYSVKLCSCPRCSRIYVIGYSVDKSLNINEDERFYQYNKRSD